MGWCCMLIVFLIYYVAGCRAFNVFSAEVFERAMNVFKVINSTGNACGFVCHWEVCVCDSLLLYYKVCMSTEMARVVRALDSQLSGRKFNCWLLQQLLLAWVTIFRQANHFSISLSHPGQLSLLFSAEREMSTSQSVMMLCSWGVSRYDSSFQLWMNV